MHGRRDDLAPRQGRWSPCSNWLAWTHGEPPLLEPDTTAATAAYLVSYELADPGTRGEPRVLGGRWFGRDDGCAAVRCTGAAEGPRANYGAHTHLHIVRRYRRESFVIPRCPSQRVGMGGILPGGGHGPPPCLYRVTMPPPASLALSVVEMRSLPAGALGVVGVG